MKRPRVFQRGQKRKRTNEESSQLVGSQSLSEDAFWETGRTSPVQELEADVGPAVSDSLGYLDFTDAVWADVTPFYQLSKFLFVSTGWNSQTKTSTVSLTNFVRMDNDVEELQSTWYHQQMIRIGQEVVFMCLCPQTKSALDCVHVRFLHEYREERFPEDDTFEMGELHLSSA
jgi:hypothetical protein